jgi:hypothetical protein
MMGIPFIAIFIMIGILFEHSYGRVFNPPPYYTSFPDAVRVIESRINWVATDKEPRIYVTGIITNQSPIAWKDVEFECRFYDTNGVMVDAYNRRSDLTIKSNDDSAFRVSVVPSRPAKDYASHKLSVSTARNDKAPF